MKQTKRWILAVLLVSLSMVFVACGSSKSDGSYYYNGEESSAAEYVPEPEEAWEEPASEEKGSGNSSQDIIADAKMIYTADISVETLKFDESVEAIKAKTAACGGYIESSSLQNYSSYRYYSFTVRIPAESYRAFCDGAEAFGEVRSFSENAENITERYYDTESRLNSAKARLESLQELMKKAETMEDIITIQQAIYDCQYEIDSLSGKLRHYDSLVGFSTINLMVQEVSRLSGTETPAIGFWQELGQSFRRGIDGFVSGLRAFVLFVARHLIGCLVFVGLVLWLILGIRRSRKKRKAMPPVMPVMPPVPPVPQDENKPE